MTYTNKKEEKAEEQTESSDRKRVNKHKIKLCAGGNVQPLSQQASQ